MGNRATSKTRPQQEKALDLKVPSPGSGKKRRKKRTRESHEIRRKTQRKTEKRKQKEKLTETKNKFSLPKDQVLSITTKDVPPLHESRPEAARLVIERGRIKGILG